MKTSKLGLAVAALIIGGCSSGGDPSGPGGTGGGDGTPVSILVQFDGSPGTLSAVLDGKTYSSSPGFVTVPSGTLEISGTFTGSFVQVSFGGFVEGGGVELNSVSTLAGPSPAVSRCSVSYTRSGAGPSTFRLKFKVVTKIGGHC